MGISLHIRHLAATLILSGVPLLSLAEKPKIEISELPEYPPLKVKVVKGYYRFVDEYGDTVRMTVLRDLYVFPPMKFKNKKQEEFYWRTVRDVRKTLPYAKLAFSTLCETYEYIQTIPDKKKREKHLKQLEKDIFEQYKPVVKSMSKRQGKVLLKLINRETDQSSFNIVKAFPRRLLADIRQVLRHEHESRLQPLQERGGCNDRPHRHPHRARRTVTRNPINNKKRFRNFRKRFLLLLLSHDVS